MKFVDEMFARIDALTVDERELYLSMTDDAADEEAPSKATFEELRKLAEKIRGLSDAEGLILNVFVNTEPDVAIDEDKVRALVEDTKAMHPDDLEVLEEKIETVFLSEDEGDEDDEEDEDDEDDEDEGEG